MESMFYGATQPIFKRAEELRKNQTEDERLLWLYLKSNQLEVRFKRQHPVWMYIADFYCHELKLVIELDGSIHGVKEVAEHDKLREEDILSFGIKVIRFTNKEVRTNIDNVIERIKSVVNELKKNKINNEESN
ncbi:MAG: endonuclease domain-containing protein [Chitinophagaceae bacterium]|nr:endonuclease domain-containing protein [Chitinophagaceae bacterium]